MKRAKKDFFKKIIPFDEHSGENLSILAFFKEINLFFKKPMYVLKKNHLFNVLRNLDVNGNCATNW